MSKRLDLLSIKGFRSIEDVTLSLSPINVLIGPNGSGKSNLLAFFQLLARIRTQSLGSFVGRSGGAAAMLHYGPKQTPALEFRLEFVQDDQQSAYCARLGHAAGDSLVFLHEQVSERRLGQPWQPPITFGAGHAESQLPDARRDPAATIAQTIDWWLSRINFFHFHDTSTHAALRTLAPAHNHQYLRSDGGNLAAYLLWLSQAQDPSAAAAWKRINLLVREVAPFIKRLKPTPVGVLDPDSFDIASSSNASIRLDWIDQNDATFGPHQLSDGSLRAIALITALAQPPETLPAIISIDEPELGLHPAAIGILASLLRSAATQSQVIVATQSPTLLDYFEPEQVLVTENVRGRTQFERLDPEPLRAWTDEYKLSELFSAATSSRLGQQNG